MFRRRRRHISDSNSGSDSPVLLINLSLFIMLLAFFIVLNAVSSFDEQKAQPVLQSLSNTFTANSIPLEVVPMVVTDDSYSLHEGETVDRLDALFRAQITAYDKVEHDDRGVMEVTLPLDVFTEAVNAIGQEDLSKASPDKQVAGKKFFLPTLASILKSDKTGTPYRVDVLLHVPGNPADLQNRDPKPFAETMKRGGELSMRLEKAGLPQKLLSIGLEKGDPKTVRLLFRPHVPFTPLAGKETP